MENKHSGRKAMEGGDLADEQRRRLGFIKASGQSLLSKLNDLLDMSKISAGQVVLTRGPVDAQTLADSALASFIRRGGDKDLSLELRLAPGARGHWVGDPARIAQVLDHLIANAVKFTDRGTILVDISPGVEGLVLSVADTGVGIRPDNLARVFERFMQADASTTRRYGGPGLGLTICRDLVRLMKGDIKVQSVDGVGATFAVHLPLARSAAVAPTASVSARRSSPLPEPGGLKVLAAEDNAINQVVLKTLLRTIGVALTLVANGREAVSAWQDGDFDVVLMDIHMPVLNGIEAAKLIRQGERVQRRRRTPIIAVTASVLDSQKAAYRAAGIDATVEKPIQLARLVGAIDALLAPAEPHEARMSG